MRKSTKTLPFCPSPVSPFIADLPSSRSVPPCYNQSMLLKNKTILVTGADGFIGSHLTEALVKKNAKTDKIKNDIEILAPTLYNSSGSCGNSFTEWHSG